MNIRKGIVFRELLTLASNNAPRCELHTTACRRLFWEPDVKGGYNKEERDQTNLQLMREGLKELKREIGLWRNEVAEKLESDPILQYQPGVVDKQWVIHSKKDLEQWVVTSDSDHGQGYSTCQFTISPQGNGLFSGVLDNQTPKDGRLKRSGYCSIRSKRARKSFKRDSYHDWTPYTHLVMRVRGDGRSYMLNIATCGYFDQLWNDMFSYILFTRGGPYWQIAKIPFSKFFFSSKGRIQDLQHKVPLDKVTNFGITAGDKINGPFSLEIDYVGLEFDPLHTEEFAYEMYRIPKNIAAT